MTLAYYKKLTIFVFFEIEHLVLLREITNTDAGRDLFILCLPKKDRYNHESKTIAIFINH